MKKKISVWLLVCAMMLGVMTGCTKGTANKKSGDKYSIVCTIFPEYDWVKEILGDQIDNFEITLLLDNGVDLHNYQPTADDITKIASCDLFIYVGGESDEWVEDALAESINKNMQVINLLESLGDAVKEEEVVEGMEAEEEEEEEGEEGEEEEVEYDEHVWLSLNNAQVLTSVISDAIQKVNPDNKSVYEENTAAYNKKLAELDGQYKDAVTKADQKVLLFGDRFPFRYLVDDYGIDYYAAFVGCSAETEASFETITFLAGKVDELKLSAVCVIESSDQKIAGTIISTTQNQDQKIVVFDSLQQTTKKDIENGASYYGAMQQNLEVLKDALNVSE